MDPKSVKVLIEQAEALASLDRDIQSREIADPLSAMPEDEQIELQEELLAVAHAQQDAYVGLSNVVVG